MPPVLLLQEPTPTHDGLQFEEFGILSPHSLGGSSSAVQLYLSSVDSVWQQAVEAEVIVVLPLDDTYWGERTGKIVDAFGHVWILSRQTELVSKDEILKRAEGLFGHGIVDTAVEAYEIETVDVETISAVGVEEALPVVDIEETLIAEKIAKKVEDKAAVKPAIKSVEKIEEKVVVKTTEKPAKKVVEPKAQSAQH